VIRFQLTLYIMRSLCDSWDCCLLSVSQPHSPPAAGSDDDDVNVNLGKDGKKRKNKKRDVNTRTKAGHGTDMDVFIDEVSIQHNSTSLTLTNECLLHQ